MKKKIGERKPSLRYDYYTSSLDIGTYIATCHNEYRYCYVHREVGSGITLLCYGKSPVVFFDVHGRFRTCKLI